MREKIKCIDGPMEGEEILLDRRLYLLYDYTELEDDEGFKHRYQIAQTGLRYAPLA